MLKFFMLVLSVAYVFPNYMVLYSRKVLVAAGRQLACMAVRRGASSVGSRCTKFIRDTRGLPDYDDVISNWTEYAVGASPRYLKPSGFSCEFPQPTFQWCSM